VAGIFAKPYSQEPVGEHDLASSGLFSASLHPAVSTIETTTPASPSLSGEKTLALGPTMEFSDRLLVRDLQSICYLLWFTLT
jgi:hypothetical protein